MTEPAHAPDRQASLLFQHATADLTPDVEQLVALGTARGRGRRRRRRIGTSLAAAAAIGVIGVAASVGPDLVGDGAGSEPGFADESTTTTRPTTSEQTEPSTAQPVPIDASVVVPAARVPAVFDDLLVDGAPGEILQTDRLPFRDERQHKIVHFEWDGTLTSFSIERADSLATCEELVDPVNQANGEPGGVCVFRDGLETLSFGPDTADGVTAQGAMVWQHGYIVSATSYNAPEGKDVEPATELPPISAADLLSIASDQVWFEPR